MLELAWSKKPDQAKRHDGAPFLPQGTSRLLETVRNMPHDIPDAHEFVELEARAVLSKSTLSMLQDATSENSVHAVPGSQATYEKRPAHCYSHGTVTAASCSEGSPFFTAARGLISSRAWSICWPVNVKTFSD